ncbi:unnamed protein product [Darwinula stevensoni]|uniref:Uncharacterized protein n=1 Tax=Darwinula stevensoni TaxID=69355 RepID=A0A7R9AGH4_9CRUS|nr:unnamed protein product [Darwinula stevensoni]CAG0904025.1 unnamed protein product [Darwinula stevensoni]
MGLIEQPLPFKKKVHATPSPPRTDSADLPGSSRDAHGAEGDRAEPDASPPFSASFDHEAAACPEESVFTPSISLSDDERVFSWQRHLALPMKPSVYWYVVEHELLEVAEGANFVYVDESPHNLRIRRKFGRNLVGRWEKRRQQAIDERCLTSRPSLAYITSTDNIKGNLKECSSLPGNRRVTDPSRFIQRRLRRDQSSEMGNYCCCCPRSEEDSDRGDASHMEAGSSAVDGENPAWPTSKGHSLKKRFLPSIFKKKCASSERVGMGLISEQPLPFKKREKVHATPSPPRTDSADLPGSSPLPQEEPLPFKKREKVHATPSPPRADSADLPGSSRDARGAKGDRAEADASPPFPASFDHEAAACPEESVFTPSISLSDDKRVFSWKRHLALPMKPSGRLPVVGVGEMRFTSRPGVLAFGVRLLHPPLPSNRVMELEEYMVNLSLLPPRVEVSCKSSAMLVSIFLPQRSWFLPPELAVAAFFEEDCMMLNMQHRVGSGTEETKKICRRYHHPVLPIKVTVLESRGRTAMAMSVDYDAVDNLFPSLSRYLGSAKTGKGRNDHMEDEEGGCLIQELI